MMIDPRGHRMSGKWVGTAGHSTSTPAVDLDLVSSDTNSAHGMRTGQTDRLLGGVAVALPAVAWFADDPEAVSKKIVTTLRSLDGKPASPGGTLSRSSLAGA
jgi:hypothetical protein